jgi:nucleoside-diphosphate-sugar epimerase
MKNSILITGSTGFLGKAQVKNFLVKDFNLIGLHIVRDGKPRNKKTLTHENIYVNELKDIRGKISNKNIIAIIHLATDYGLNDESNVKLCNYDYPKTLLQLSESIGIKYFINADSFFSDLPQSYSYLKQYRLWKKSFRDFAITNSINKKIYFINMRIFHMFGPNDSPGKFVFDMFEQIRANKSIIDLTECDQLRDFVYIDDVVTAFETVFLKRYKIKDFYKNFDVGSGKKLSIKSFLLILKRHLKSSSNLNFGALPKREGEHYLDFIHADNQGLKQIGWKNEDLEKNIITLLKYQ